MRWAILALLAVSSPCFAQKVNISVDASTDDTVGKQIAYHVRDKIAKSALLKMVYGENVGSISLKLTTLNPDDDNGVQHWAVYAYVLTLNQKDGLDGYLTSGVGTCGSSKVESCALSLVAKIDDWADTVRKLAAGGNE